MLVQFLNTRPLILYSTLTNDCSSLFCAQQRLNISNEFYFRDGFMYVCVCVCMCVYVCVCVLCVCVCMHLFCYEWKESCAVCVRTCVCVGVYVCACICLRMCVCVCVHLFLLGMKRELWHQWFIGHTRHTYYNCNHSLVLVFNIISD